MSDKFYLEANVKVGCAVWRPSLQSAPACMHSNPAQCLKLVLCTVSLGISPMAAMLSTVDALLPLSLLEAVRNVDTPNDDFDAEYVDELRNKRFGLSETVYVQIRRHTEAVKRRQRVAQEESMALARLIGRRPDAEAVFRAAGRYLAREAYLTISPVTRGMLRILPAIIARPLALRRARKIARRYLSGSVRRVGSFLLLEVPRSITLNTAPGSIGCAYYESALRELLRLLIGSVGAVEHVRCGGRDEGSCEWRADWRSLDRKAARAAVAAA